MPIVTEEPEAAPPDEATKNVEEGRVDNVETTECGFDNNKSYSWGSLNSCLGSHSLNVFLAVLSINACLSLLSCNTFCSVLSVNSAFSILSVNSFFAIGCRGESFAIC